jgi:hypothetical protein
MPRIVGDRTDESSVNPVGASGFVIRFAPLPF